MSESPKKRTFNADRPQRNTKPRTKSAGGYKKERPEWHEKKQEEKPRRFKSKERSYRSYNEHDEKPQKSYNRKSRFENSEHDEKPQRRFNRDPHNTRSKDTKHRFADSQEEHHRRRRRDITAESPILSEIVAKRKREGRQAPQRQKVLSLAFEEQHGPIRLNKYIANAGICSRRDADILITTGAITVNGEVITELGTKILPTDEVRYGDKVLQREKPIYLLLNKPKDYITTTDDDRDRPHVMQLVQNACKERIYPVGRLDRNTTGLLLFTNDGEMTKKLTHPRHLIRKMYYVELNKNLAHNDFNLIKEGLELSDGLIKPDELDFVGDSKKELGITIHSGKNRIVRRIFESIGYEVIKLDRVVFAGLTKKDLPRGHWRFLSEAEVNILKMSINKKEK